MPGQLLLTSAGIGLAVVFPIAVAQLAATTEFASTNRFAAIGTGLIAILTGYVLACFAMNYGFMQTLANPEFYLFLNSIGCFLAGIVVFTFVHQFAPSWIGLTPICKSGELVKKRFSLLSLIVWTSCICALLGIFLKQDLFPSHLWAAFGIQLSISFGVSLCIHLVVTLPITAWLVNIRPIGMSALSLVFVTFVAATISALVAAELDPRHVDACLLSVGAATMTATTFSIWTISYCLIRDDGPIHENQRKNAGFGILAKLKTLLLAVTTCFYIYAIAWLALHFIAVGTERNRDLMFRTELLKNVEGDLGDHEVIAEQTDQSSNTDLVQLANLINRNGIKRSDNVMFQLAKTSIIDSIYESAEYRELLGFTTDEIEGLIDHRVHTWMSNKRAGNNTFLTWRIPPSVSRADPSRAAKAFRTYASNNQYCVAMRRTSWNKSQLPLASEYCREKEEVFEAIRNAANCPQAFDPITEDYPWGWEVTFYAQSMLEMESNFRLGRGEIDQAIENCLALMKLHQVTQSLARRPDFRSAGIHVAIRIVSSSKCTNEQLQHVKSLVSNSTQMTAEQTPGLLQLYAQASHLPGCFWQSRDLQNKLPLERFCIAYPQSVDWLEYVATVHELYAQEHALSQQSLGVTLRFSEVDKYSSRIRSEMSRSKSFLGQATTFFRGPKSKGRFLAMQDFYSFPRSAHFQFEQQTIKILGELVFALEVFHCQHKCYPKSLDELTPDVLSSIPDDPYADRPLIYHRFPRGYNLYSVGPTQESDSFHVKSGIHFPDVTVNFFEYLNSKTSF